MARFRLFVLLLASAAALASPALKAEKLDLQKELAELQEGAAELREVDKQIEGASERRRPDLLYRRDQRTYQLILGLDALIDEATELAADHPDRVAVTGFLEQSYTSINDASFVRIADLGERMAALAETADGASGTGLLEAEAGWSALDRQRYQYLDGLVRLEESRSALGFASEASNARLLNVLMLLGESAAGRIESVAVSLQSLAKRAKLEPSNADVKSAAARLQRQQQQALSDLAVVVDMLQRLQQDAETFREILLHHSQGLTVSTLDSAAFGDYLAESWRVARETVSSRAPDLVLNLVLVAIILLLFRWLSRGVRWLVRTACERPGVDMSTLLKDVLVSLSGGAVMVAGILVALSQVGISLGPMLTGLGIAGFIVGFALQDTLGNFAAGGMILIYRPYDVDDFVEVAGVSGLVKKMSLVSTTITTFDNQTLVIPNSKIWGDVIKNVTAQRVRRVDMVFGIGYGDDVPRAEQVLLDILEQHDKVLNTPEPTIRLHELGDSSVNFVVRPWVRTADYWDVYWDVTREVKLRFDREGISIPFPQRDVHLYREEA